MTSFFSLSNRLRNLTWLIPLINRSSNRPKPLRTSLLLIKSSSSFLLEPLQLISKSNLSMQLSYSSQTVEFSISSNQARRNGQICRKRSLSLTQVAWYLNLPSRRPRSYHLEDKVEAYPYIKVLISIISTLSPC